MVARTMMIQITAKRLEDKRIRQVSTKYEVPHYTPGQCARIDSVEHENVDEVVRSKDGH